MRRHKHRATTTGINAPDIAETAEAGRKLGHEGMISGKSAGRFAVKITDLVDCTDPKSPITPERKTADSIRTGNRVLPPLFTIKADNHVTAKIQDAAFVLGDGPVVRLSSRDALLKIADDRPAFHPENSGCARSEQGDQKNREAKTGNAHGGCRILKRNYA